MYLVRPPYFLKIILREAVWRKDPSEKKIYLTFDDGPIPLITPWVLNLLNEEKIKATFFCLGKNVEQNTAIYQRILQDGHSVGNHSFNHPNGWKTDSKTYVENVEQCATLVHSSLFRPPYGRLKKSQISILKSQYSIIMWDVLSGDYDLNTSPQQCLVNCTTKLRNGSIIVFHDSVKAKEKLEFALPRFIAFAKEKGYEFGVL